MKLLIPVFTSMLVLCSCSSNSNIQETVRAARVVSQADGNSIEQLSIASLTNSFLKAGSECHHHDTVVEISGEVVAYGLVDGGVYTITLRQDDKDAMCMFDDTISDQLGGGREVSSGANLVIRGQCQSSGFFASHSFILNGCSLITN